MITKRDIDDTVEKLGRLTNEDIRVEYSGSPIRPRLYHQNYGDELSVRELSPRMSRGDLYNWMDGFYEGLKFADDMSKKPIKVSPHHSERMLRFKAEGEGIHVEEILRHKPPYFTVKFSTRGILASGHADHKLLIREKFIDGLKAFGCWIENTPITDRRYNKYAVPLLYKASSYIMGWWSQLNHGRIDTGPLPQKPASYNHTFTFRRKT